MSWTEQEFAQSYPPTDTSLTCSVMQGVLLTHRALVSVVAATKAFIDQISPNIANGESIDQNDAILSYLPLVRVQSATLSICCVTHLRVLSGSVASIVSCTMMQACVMCALHGKEPSTHHPNARSVASAGAHL